MDWNGWNGKKVFVKLKDGAVYSGQIFEIDAEATPIIFISLIDKFGDRVTITSSEIVKIKEEDNGY